ncbi:hypothetical protein LINPERHAP1_LOCUS43177 [Linum perenne]
MVTEGAATTEKDAKVPDEDNGTVRAETNPEEVKGRCERKPDSDYILMVERGAVAPVKASGLVLNRDTAGKQAIRVVERQADDG